MIAAWMSYAIVISALLAAAAFALELYLKQRGRPTRGAWVMQILAAVGIPLWAWLPDFPFAARGEGAASSVPIFLEPFQVTLSEASPIYLLDRPLLVLWVLLSSFLAVRTALSTARMFRMRAAWRAEELDGAPVLVSENVGPAVAGVLRPEIVMPRWLMETSPGRELVMAHEREHLESRDAQLLAGASMVLALVPWNPVLWWSLRRLRLATEIDCDARVLRKYPGRLREYCELLLSVGLTRGIPLWAPALSEPRTLLERRIDTMTRLPKPDSPFKLLMLTGVVSVGVGLACFYPSPFEPTEEEGSPDSLTATMESTVVEPELADGPTFTPFTVAPGLDNTADVRRALEAGYPPLLRDAGIGGTVNIWFFIDATGAVQETRIQKSSGHPALDQAALGVAETMRFTPARNRNDPVPVWVAFPITFTTN